MQYNAMQVILQFFYLYIVTTNYNFQHFFFVYIYSELMLQFSILFQPSVDVESWNICVLWTLDLKIESDSFVFWHKS